MIVNNSADYATMKVVYNLMKLDPNQNIAVRGAVGNNAVGQTENIYVVGHGGPGQIWDANKSPINLSQLAGDIKNIIPDDWEGEVRVLTCRSAVGTDDSQKSVKTVVETLKSKVEDYLGDQQVTVRGTTGYSYGTPQTQQSGLTSVLDKKYWVFYNKSFEEGKHAMASIFSDKDGVPKSTIRKELEKAAKKDGEIESGESKYKLKEGMFVSPESPAEMAKAWTFVRDILEDRFEALVKQASNNGQNSIQNTVAALANEDDWDRLLQDQELEFQAYDMYAEGEKAFQEG